MSPADASDGSGIVGPVENNYISTFTFRSVTASEFTNELAARFGVLNHFDELLLEWTEELCGRARCTDAVAACARWRAALERQENLVGARHAADALRHVSVAVDLEALIAQEHEIVSALHDVDVRALGATRVNLFAPFNALEPVTHLLLGELGRLGIIHRLDRIEIARYFGEGISGAGSATPSFPTVMVYFDDAEPADDVATTVEILRRVAAALPTGDAPLRRFEVPLHPNLTAAQGYRLLKKLLDPLGLLDDFYDPETGHATLRGERSNALTAALRTVAA